MHTLETIQIWFISDNALGLHKKNTLKTEPHKAEENTRSLYSISLCIFNLDYADYNNVYYADTS